MGKTPLEAMNQMEKWQKTLKVKHSESMTQSE